MIPFLLSTVSGMAISLSATIAEGISSTSTVTSNTVAATISGGTPPYTYAWARLSGSTLITALNPADASTAFRASGLTRGQSVEAVFQLTVTDAAAQIKQSAAVTVTLERSDLDGGGGTL